MLFGVNKRHIPILIVIMFALASCTHPPPTKPYAEWIESHKVEVFYERGYKDFFKQLPAIDDPCFHAPEIY